MMFGRCWMIGSVVLAVSVGPSAAAAGGQRFIDETASPEPAALAPTAEEQGAGGPPALSGPRVAETARRRTLVKRDFEGRLVRLEMEPARAAVELLDLDERSRAAADRILLERDALMDRLMTDHLREIAEMAAAFEAKETARGLQLLRPLMDAARPIRDRGLLVKELASVLPPERARELELLTQEYWRAAVADRKAIGGDNGEKLGTVQAFAHEGMMAFGQEIKRAYERTLGAGEKEYERFLAKLGLTPEQESIVRREYGLLFEKTYGKATPEQEKEVFWKVWKVLDTPQRKIVLEHIAEERRAEVRALRDGAKQRAGAAAGGRGQGQGGGVDESRDPGMGEQK